MALFGVALFYGMQIGLEGCCHHSVALVTEFYVGRQAPKQHSEGTA